MDLLKFAPREYDVNVLKRRGKCVVNMVNAAFATPFTPGCKWCGKSDIHGLCFAFNPSFWNIYIIFMRGKFEQIHFFRPEGQAQGSFDKRWWTDKMNFIWFEGNKITLWRDLTKLESRKINVASFKHPAAVRKCVFSKGCKYLATYAADGVLRVFMVSFFMDVETACIAGRAVLSYRSHFRKLLI